MPRAFGTSANYLKKTTTQAFVGPAFSACGWLWRISGGVGYIFSLASGTTNAGSRIRILYDASNKITGIIDYATTDAQCVAATAATANSWQHWALTWDGTNWRAYINGIEESPTVTAPAGASRLTSSVVKALVGRGAPETGSENLALFDLAVWDNVVLSPGEVRALHNGVVRPNQLAKGGLRYYFPLDNDHVNLGDAGQCDIVVWPSSNRNIPAPINNRTHSARIYAFPSEAGTDLTINAEVEQIGVSDLNGTVYRGRAVFANAEQIAVMGQSATVRRGRAVFAGLEQVAVTEHPFSMGGAQISAFTEELRLSALQASIGYTQTRFDSPPGARSGGIRASVYGTSRTSVGGSRRSAVSGSGKHRAR